MEYLRVDAFVNVKRMSSVITEMLVGQRKNTMKKTNREIERYREHLDTHDSG